MAGTMVVCFFDVAKACATACTRGELKTFFIYLLQICGCIPGPNHMILAKDLTMHDPQCWVPIDPKDTRFKEIMLLEPDSQSWEIKALISSDLVLANKTYGAYLIFKTTNGSQGLEAVLTATVSTDIGDETTNVCLSKEPKADANQTSGSIKSPRESSNYKDWMELELGVFFYSKREEISIKIKESGKHHMGGFYVAGIELRYIPFEP